MMNVHKIGTWNVRFLLEEGKLQNLTQEMKRLEIPILGACETRWPESGKVQSDGYTVFYSGSPIGVHRNGVAIVLKNEIAEAVINFVPFSERIILVQLGSRPVNVNIIQVYAPTADKDDEVIEQFYEGLDEALSYTKAREVNIVMGDFNAKVGEGPSNKVIGKYGLGARNERGDRLVQYCLDKDLVIQNTWFQLPKRRLCTWKSPQDGHDNRIVRNQIDFIMINQRFRNIVKAAKAYPGADIKSDHNLLCAKLKLRLKKETAPGRPKNFNLEALNTRLVAEVLEGQIKSGLENVEIDEIKSNSVDISWDKIKKAITLPCEKLLSPTKPPKKNGWMTDEILELMEQRRLHKNNAAEYKRLNSIIKQKIKEAKDVHLQKSCAEIEELQMKHDDFHLHKMIKVACGMFKKRNPPVPRDSNGRYIISPNDQCAEWTNYIQTLFDDQREEFQINLEDPISGPHILESEVKQAIEKARKRKAPGPDNLPVELLKLLDETGIIKLTALFNQIYLTGQLPQEWTKSVFIPLPKKCKPSGCADYRLISLMSHTLKILLRVIQNRIKARCESKISDTQFGFRGGLGTREAIFGMNILLQKLREFQKPVYVCFLDFEKAFDRVQHLKLIRALKQIGLDDRDVTLLKNLYWNQTATVQVTREQESDCIPIKRGVRQGCVLSPDLFNVYSEIIFSKALEDRKEGV